VCWEKVCLTVKGAFRFCRSTNEEGGLLCGGGGGGETFRSDKRLSKDGEKNGEPTRINGRK